MFGETTSHSNAGGEGGHTTSTEHDTKLEDILYTFKYMKLCYYKILYC